MSLKDPQEHDADRRAGQLQEHLQRPSSSSSAAASCRRSWTRPTRCRQLTHERRLSALGPGGLNRKRAGFEVRDVHISHYGRICPIETPEGTNIGLIASLSHLRRRGRVRLPDHAVPQGRATARSPATSMYLRADEEIEGRTWPRRTRRATRTARLKQDTVHRPASAATSHRSPRDEVQYVDISPKQMVGVSAGLIPFLEHDDANRALMGSNMQRQAVPLLRHRAAARGHRHGEGTSPRTAAWSSGPSATARSPTSTPSASSSTTPTSTSLRKFVGLNERTCLNQKPIVKIGQQVKKGQIIADGAGTCQGELALGRNVLVAFMTCDGYNFEDAIVISERLVKNDTFTSIHIEEFDDRNPRDQAGPRGVHPRHPQRLREGPARTSTRTASSASAPASSPGDILVGKVAPKSKSELTPEEKLLHAIFGRAGEDVKNDSLEVPAGVEGVVIDTQRFSRRMHMTDEQKKQLREGA